MRISIRVVLVRSGALLLSSILTKVLGNAIRFIASARLSAGMSFLVRHWLTMRLTVLRCGRLRVRLVLQGFRPVVSLVNMWCLHRARVATTPLAMTLLSVIMAALPSGVVLALNMTVSMGTELVRTVSVVYYY